MQHALRLPGLAIYIWDDSVAVHVPGWDDPDYLDTDYGASLDLGFDYNDLPGLKAQINRAAEEAISYAERRLRELPVQRGGTRPSTIDREARELGVLHYHLLTAEPLRTVARNAKPIIGDSDIEPCGCPKNRATHGAIGLLRAEKDRVYDLAASLGIRIPRSSV